MAYTLGKPNDFVQGMVDQTFYSPSTGDVIAYDRVGNEAAVNYGFELSELTGGFNNQFIGAIPHSTRLTGTYTSTAFSLEQRALISGGEVNYNGAAFTCETITASSTTLTVTSTPVKSYNQPASDTTGWCYVRERGSDTYLGTNYGVDLTTKVVDFTATSGKTYEVFYFTSNASAQVLNLPLAAQPNVISVQQKWGVYTTQNSNNGNSIFKGYLYLYVPLAILEGDAGIDGNQTTNSTTPYNWRAISPTENMPDAGNCTDDSSLAYFVFVPCGNTAQSATALVVSGGSVTITKGSSVAVPVFFIMQGNKLAVPNYSNLTFATLPSGITASGNVLTATAQAGAITNPITVTYTEGDVTYTTIFNLSYSV